MKRKNKKRETYAFLAVSTLLIVLTHHVLQSKEPDAVNSRNVNGACFLTVSANGIIEEKERFAAHLIQMCRENQFLSLKISTDIEGYPQMLDITVYLRKTDVGKRDPVMHIQYVPRSGVKNVNIQADPERYDLFIDGKRVGNMI